MLLWLTTWMWLELIHTYLIWHHWITRRPLHGEGAWHPRSTKEKATNRRKQQETSTNLTKKGKTRLCDYGSYHWLAPSLSIFSSPSHSHWHRCLWIIFSWQGFFESQSVSKLVSLSFLINLFFQIYKVHLLFLDDTIITPFVSFPQHSSSLLVQTNQQHMTRNCPDKKDRHRNRVYIWY